MNLSAVMRPRDLTVTGLTYTDAKPLTNGGKQVFVNFNNKTIKLQTPTMVLPYDLGHYEETGKPAPLYDVMNLSFRNKDSDEEIATFYNAIHKFDEAVLEKAVTQAMSWFKKTKINPETLRELYTPMIKIPLDKETMEPTDKYPPTFKIKVPADATKCPVYDEKCNEMQDIGKLDQVIVKGTMVRVIIQCTGIWFAGGKFGCSWKALQIQIKQQPEGMLKGFAFTEDIVEEEEETSK